MIYTNTLSSTGSTTAEDVGLGNVDDTSDANKPVSTAQQTALNAKVAIADIANSLSVDIANVPLSAKMGKVLKGHIDTINALLQSDADSLDTLQEVVDYVKLNRSDLETLSVSGIAGLQTALDAKVDTSDGRLSDSREWSGLTVSQAEAEAGTSTARRAWTAQRIKQAINKVVSTLSDAATTSVAAIRAGTTKANVGLSNVDDYSRSHYDGRYLAGGAKAADSNKLDGLNSSDFVRDNGDSGMSGDYSTTDNIESGRGSGGVALTINDSQGNANVTFNHADGIAEQDGNSGRITVNTDSTTNAAMTFGVLDNGSSGTVHTIPVMSITENGIEVIHGSFSGDGSGLTGTASMRATGTTKADVGLSNIPNLGVSSTAMADSIMQRNSSGDTWARLFRSSYSTANPDIAGIYTTKTIGSD